MLLTQRQGHCVERVVGRTPGASLVGRLKAFGLVAEAVEQLPNRPGAEVQGAGDGSGGLAAARPPLDEEAKGQREWRWHGNPRTWDSGMTIAYSSAAARQNLYVGISGATYCRVTGTSVPR
jgi:hypothetical protein